MKKGDKVRTIYGLNWNENGGPAIPAATVGKVLEVIDDAQVWVAFKEFGRQLILKKLLEKYS